MPGLSVSFQLNVTPRRRLTVFNASAIVSISFFLFRSDVELKLVAESSEVEGLNL